MQDPEEWNVVGVHWHAYVEVRDGRQQFGNARTDRLRRDPGTVLRTPEEVADWIADMTSKHVPAKPIRLIGPGGGVGHVGDQGHIEHDLAHNLDTLCRGDSLYTDFPREHDRLHLWAEAVATDECTFAHGDRE